MPRPDYMSAYEDLDLPETFWPDFEAGYSAELDANTALLADRDSTIAGLNTQIQTQAAVIESLQTTNLALIAGIGISTGDDDTPNENDAPVDDEAADLERGKNITLDDLRETESE